MNASRKDRVKISFRITNFYVYYKVMVVKLRHEEYNKDRQLCAFAERGGAVPVFYVFTDKEC